ncbi:MAG: DNA-methyltransferase [Promethearchaeota archaeon]
MSNSSKKLVIDNQTVFFKSSEKMHELQDNLIDVIVTSPPYNRGKNYSSDSNEKYDDSLPEVDYFKMLKRVWKDCLRVSSEKSVLFLNIGDSATTQGFSEKVAQSAEEIGWVRIQDIIWVKSIYGKGHYTPSGRNKRFNNIWEHIFLFVKNKEKYELDPKAIGIPYADKSNIGRYGNSDLRDPGNVLHICYENTTGATIKKGHDAPFPIGLPYFCIKAVPNVKYVLDPFLGTGTTLAAAKSLGLYGFGYEKYPREKLIKETIENFGNYSPKPPILIPHYETSIKALISFLENSEIEIEVPKTKKGKLNMEILLDTLNKMDIESQIKEKIQEKLNFSKKIQDKET